MKNPAIGCLLLLGVMLQGCGSQPYNLGQPGKSLTYVSGTPSFDLEVLPGDTAGTIKLYCSLPYPSLTFLRNGEIFSASVDISAEVFQEGGDSLGSDAAWTETVEVASYEATIKSVAAVFTETMRGLAGSQRIVVVVQDRATGRSERRSQFLEMPNPAFPKPLLGRIELQAAAEQGGWETVIPFHVPSSPAGLRCKEHIYGLADGEAVPLCLSLLHYRMSQQPADPPDVPRPSQLTEGIEQMTLGTGDTVIAHTDTVVGRGSEASCSMHLGTLAPGLYLLGAQAEFRRTASRESTIVRTRRVVSVKSPTFPRPSTLKDLVDAMTYILKRDERERFLGSPGPATTKMVFDSLWLSFGGNPEKASGLIRLYYSRVEEANRRFSDYRDGWKTDRGMIYVVFGPPSSVENSSNLQIWYYASSQGMDEVAFAFRPATVGSADLMMRTSVLNRGLQYASIWHSMTERWRRGRIL